MDTETKNKSKKEAGKTICRNQLSHRFAGVQARLVRKGLGRTFVRTARASQMGEMGFMGSLVFNAIIGGPLAGFVSNHVPLACAHHGLAAHFNHDMLTGAFEGISALQDIKNMNATRKIDRPSALYPQGRRKAAIKIKRARNKFNKLAGNRKGKFSEDVQMDLAEMFRLADMLAGVEQENSVKNDKQDDVSGNDISAALKKVPMRSVQLAI